MPRGYDPGSQFEEEGIPDLQDGTPEQQRAVDPQEAPLPGEEPIAADEYGTTAQEAIQGEPLTLRLEREEPDVTEDLLRLREPDEPIDYDVEPEEHAGRLVEADEGARTDTDKEVTATDYGADGGGFSAEERAMHYESDRGPEP